MTNFREMVKNVYGSTQELLYLFDGGELGNRTYCIVVRIPKNSLRDENVKKWFVKWYNHNGSSTVEIKRGLLNLVECNVGVEIFSTNDLIYLDDLKALPIYKKLGNLGIAFEHYMVLQREKNCFSSYQADKEKKQDIKIGYTWENNTITYRWCQLKASVKNASVNIQKREEIPFFISTIKI